jgi:UDP-glucose 4-epimerase
MILLTGATGYIGSHIWLELLKNGQPAIGLDNFSNSSIEVLNRIEAISNQCPSFVQGDIRDFKCLNDLFSKYKFTHVIHLAALKSVQESAANKIEYFDVNVGGFKNLLRVMRLYDCTKIIFSSSAAVYSDKAISPISEMAETAPSNYYGETKLEGERLLADEFRRVPAISSISLRCFNVAGNHSSGMLTNCVNSKSRSLFAEIERFALGETQSLPIYGIDWGTHDGTCIRDYLHVSDLVKGITSSIELFNGGKICVSINLGLGMGKSVYEVIATYEHVSGRFIPRESSARRIGDVAVSFCNTQLATQLIDWRPTRSIPDICLDSFRSCSS